MPAIQYWCDGPRRAALCEGVSNAAGEQMSAPIEFGHGFPAGALENASGFSNGPYLGCDPDAAAIARYEVHR